MRTAPQKITPDHTASAVRTSGFWPAELIGARLVRVSEIETEATTDGKTTRSQRRRPSRGLQSSRARRSSRRSSCQPEAAAGRSVLDDRRRAPGDHDEMGVTEIYASDVVGVWADYSVSAVKGIPAVQHGQGRASRLHHKYPERERAPESARESVDHAQLTPLAVERKEVEPPHGESCQRFVERHARDLDRARSVGVAPRQRAQQLSCPAGFCPHRIRLR